MAEAVYPTLGDDDCAIVSDAGPVQPIHPGYVGDTKVLDAPLAMAPDGLCLHHCIIAATNLVKYMAPSVPERATQAEELRTAISSFPAGTAIGGGSRAPPRSWCPGPRSASGSRPAYLFFTISEFKKFLKRQEFLKSKFLNFKFQNF